MEQKTTPKNPFLIIIIIIVVVVTVTPTEGLKVDDIVSRHKWEAQPSKHYVPNLQRKLPHLIVHSTFTPSCYDLFQCSLRLRSVQKMHMLRGSPDINYNYLIGGDGRVYEGRGSTLQGSHTEMFDSRSLGVAFVGNFNSADTKPSHQMVQALLDLYQLSVKNNVLQDGASMHFHSDAYCISCPGIGAKAVVKNLPQYKGTLEDYFCS